MLIHLLKCRFVLQDLKMFRTFLALKLIRTQNNIRFRNSNSKFEKDLITSQEIQIYPVEEAGML